MTRAWVAPGTNIEKRCQSARDCDSRQWECTNDDPKPCPGGPILERESKAKHRHAGCFLLRFAVLAYEHHRLVLVPTGTGMSKERKKENAKKTGNENENGGVMGEKREQEYSRSRYGTYGMVWYGMVW